MTEAPATAQSLQSLMGLVRQAELPETMVPTYIRPDLVTRFEELDDLHAAALEKEGNDARINVKSESKRIAEQMAALQEEMAASLVEMHLRAQPGLEFNALLAQHRPGTDDAGYEFNQATYPQALLRVSCYSPPLAELSDADYAEFLTKLTSRQFDNLWKTAWVLNRREVAVPFSPAASRTLSSFASVSRRRTDEASASSASTAGNQPRSPRQSRTKTGK